MSLTVDKICVRAKKSKRIRHKKEKFPQNNRPISIIFYSFKFVKLNEM
jgi:hypothetical protein